MNRFAIPFLVLIGLFSANLPGTLSAQLFEDNQYVVSEMDYLGETLTENGYAIYLNLPHAGVIDLKLTDDGGKPLWITHFIKEKGKQRIGIKTNALAEGQTYTVQLRYKGIESDYSFQMPEGAYSEEMIVAN